MPKFRSIVINLENNPTWWNYTNEADTLVELESQTTYESVDQEGKTAWIAKRANDKTRIVTNNLSGTTISVVSYEETTTKAKGLKTVKKYKGGKAKPKLNKI